MSPASRRPHRCDRMAEGDVEDSTVDFDPRVVEVDDDGDFFTLMKGSADLSTCRQRKLDFSMCSSGLCD